MRKVIGNMSWMVLALFVASMTAAAQQSASAPPNPQPAAAMQPAQQPSQAQTNLAPPTTMDQVVDRVILREKELIKFRAIQTTPLTIDVPEEGLDDIVVDLDKARIEVK